MSRSTDVAQSIKPLIVFADSFPLGHCDSSLAAISSVFRAAIKVAMSKIPAWCRRLNEASVPNVDLLGCEGSTINPQWR